MPSWVEIESALGCRRNLCHSQKTGRVGNTESVTYLSLTVTFMFVNMYTSVYVWIRLDTSGYAWIRLDTLGYVWIRLDTSGCRRMQTTDTPPRGKCSPTPTREMFREAALLWPDPYEGNVRFGGWDHPYEGNVHRRWLARFFSSTSETRT